MANSNQTLVISDIHLGSTLSHADAVMDFLKKTPFKRLILLGDIFDGTHLFRFKKADWQLLNFFQKLTKDGKEVIWIKGNHDVVNGKIIPLLKGVEFVESYCWTERGETYCAIHGHQFDKMAIKNPSIKKITSKLHSLFAAYMRHQKTASLLDKFHTSVRRLSKKISEGAIEYAAKNNINYIFCAHTHIPMSLTVELPNKKRVSYFNSGSWIQEPFNYISIDENGVRVGEFNK